MQVFIRSVEFQPEDGKVTWPLAGAILVVMPLILWIFFLFYIFTQANGALIYLRSDLFWWRHWEGWPNFPDYVTLTNWPRRKQRRVETKTFYSNGSRCSHYRVTNSHVDSVTPYPLWLLFYITAGWLRANMKKNNITGGRGSQSLRGNSSPRL